MSSQVEKCKKIKDEATGLFKEKRFVEAAALYDTVSEYFADEDGAIETEEANAVFTSSMSNAAMCYIKAKDYTSAIASCGRVLKEEAEHVKCLYRRGVARMELGILKEVRRSKS